MAACMLFLAPGQVGAYDWRNRAPDRPWEPTPEQLEPCARVERDPDSLTYCKHKSDGRWTILDEALPSLIPGAFITFTDHEGRFCVYAHAPYANNGRSRPEATTSCRTPDGSYVPSDAIP
ncbi:hypothetical protein ACFOGJ_21290 [Marinibaculum pumilum]|uniref:Uncharacterized protein n=1 Tax=Marinibaculum pumilum TaxID=1766165 RepID=A0ABV7L625_9PROT